LGEWFKDGPDRGIWWWALEHDGHPCCYLRALMPGDFAPGRGVAPRHVMGLDGSRPPASGGYVLECGTCGEAVAVADLEPIERSTGQRGFLEAFRAGRVKWPRPTDPESCVECCAPRHLCAAVESPRGTVQACASCAPLVREGR
jgi:hypothetical protein